MILDDSVTLEAGAGPAGEVLAHVGRQVAQTADAGGATILTDTTRVLCELPLCDAVTGAPLELEPEDVTRIRWRGRLWTIEESPLIRRQHGVDHSVSWTVQIGGPIP